MHEQLKEFLLNFGFGKNDVAKIFEKVKVRDVNIIKAKIENYKVLLKLSDSDVRKLIMDFPTLLSFDVVSKSETSVKGKLKAYKEMLQLSDSEIKKISLTFPPLLSFDVVSESETSVKGKIKAYKELLQLSDKEIRKMIVSYPALLGYDTVSESETSVKGKIKAYKELLQLNDRKIGSLFATFPSLLGYDMISESETSVKGKIKAYKELLQLSDDEITKMIRHMPALLFLDTSSEKISSVKTKIAKIQQMIPFDRLREVAIKTPAIFIAPAQTFKIRFMLASIVDRMPSFFNSNGLMTSEKKVWARLCHIQSTNCEAKSYVYQGEKFFVNHLGVSSEELMKKYPLDEKAVKKIEKAYFEKTGKSMALDKNERAKLGLER